MGTRGILAIMIRGKPKGLFCKFDAHPIGLGLAVLQFLASLNAEEWAELIKNMEAVEWFNPGGGTRVRPEGVDLNALYGDYGFVDVKLPSGAYEIYSSIPAWKVLPVVHKGIVKHLPDAFQRNPLYAHAPDIEYVYIIDMEAKTMETRARLPGKESPVVLDLVKTGVGDAEAYISSLMAKLEKVALMSDPSDGVWDYKSVPLEPAKRHFQLTLMESQMMDAMCGRLGMK